jgi:GNAT superfamily N-acetyltransferase
MAQKPLAVCSLLEWDSAFFGFKVGQVGDERLSVKSGRAALEWAKAGAVRCLYLLADSSSTETAEAAYELGFKVVDVRLELSLQRNQRDTVVPAEMDLRTPQPSDVPNLQRIARSAHYDSRFFFDCCFPRARAEDLFAVWIANDCAGRADKVLMVSGEHGAAYGYITCNLIKNSNIGRIGLVGVAAEARQKGVGKALVSAALKWFWSVGVETVRVITQARNIPAQRLYGAMGFRPFEVKVWYHRWF